MMPAIQFCNFTFNFCPDLKSAIKTHKKTGNQNDIVHFNPCFFIVIPVFFPEQSSSIPYEDYLWILLGDFRHILRLKPS